MVSLRQFRCFCSLVLLVVLSHAQRQWGDLKFQRFGVDKGLSVTTAFNIVQDQKGFLWISTIDGLMRYDGYHFVTYKNNYNDSSSISDNLLSTLLIGKGNKLWAGTYSGGLNCMDIATGKCKRYQNIPGNQNSLSDNRVWAVLEVGNIIWVGTENGLNAIDLATGKITRYFQNAKDPKSLCDNTVLSLMMDRNGRLWIGTTGGLSCATLDKTGKISEFKNYKHAANDPFSISANIVMSLFSNKNKTVFIGTNDGLCRYNPARDNFIITRFAPQIDTSSNLVYSYLNSYGENAVRAMYEDRYHNLWVSTDKGLKIYNPVTREFTSYNSDNSDPNSLSTDLLAGIFEDRSGNIWIGSIIGGLNKADLKPRKFNLIQMQDGNPYKLSKNNIRAIFKDSKNTLWIGTFEGGVNQLDKEATQFIQPQAKMLGNENIWNIYEDSKGNMWFGSSNGLFRYNRSTDKCEQFVHNLYSNSISSNIIRYITEDAKGLLWVGTEGGLNCFDQNSETWTNFTHHASNENSLSNNTVWNIREAYGALWVGTDNGLNKITYDSIKKTYTFKRFFPIKDDPKSISNKAVRSIWNDGDRNLWIGTSNGLNKFDPATEIFVRYNEENGLSNSYIYGVLGGDMDHLWISTNNGISRFHKTTMQFHNYTKLDGLQNNEFNTGAYFRGKDGELFFGGPDGFNRFYPDSMHENRTPPSIAITNIKVFGMDMQNEKQPFEITEIKLKHDENVISFEFAALDLTLPEKNLYSYMLEGFDKAWVNAGNRRFVNYTNLDPGEYTFKVRASNADGIWNNDGVSIKLTIVPPIWKTWWFRILLGVTIVFAIYFVYMQRVRRFKQTQLQLQHQVSLKTKELREEKEVVEKQNLLIEKKNKNITASIEYARRIQDSILPEKQDLEQWVEGSFIFYKPKDIISGDFYWVHQKDDLLFVAAADCTGHGVPGAFMSLIGYNLLNEAIKGKGLREPSQILSSIHDGFVNMLNQSTRDKESVDGMDIAFCVLNLKTKKLTFSSTDRPLNIIRKGELQNYRQGEYPLGYITNKPQNFESNTIQLEKGDVFYIYTDGYCDQFGGPQNKKYREGSFEEFLLKIHKQPMEEQEILIKEEMDKWMGKNTQVDDMLVIGIRV